MRSFSVILIAYALSSAAALTIHGITGSHTPEQSLSYLRQLGNVCYYPAGDDIDIVTSTEVTEETDAELIAEDTTIEPAEATNRESSSSLLETPQTTASLTTSGASSETMEQEAQDIQDIIPIDKAIVEHLVRQLNWSDVSNDEDISSTTFPQTDSTLSSEVSSEVSSGIINEASSEVSSEASIEETTAAIMAAREMTVEEEIKKEYEIALSKHTEAASSEKTEAASSEKTEATSSEKTETTPKKTQEN